ncbi:hypothetical protein K353_00856 [Kitasatospora sp. SolWspMP-SS2h]|nr:hypothetical protein [Kitasatospora sp. SolWspMP-SS2h]RAJ45358.1 hypothetical protein K353_00856 [Kitasatospora sp. SolWspMP-SS2h]
MSRNPPPRTMTADGAEAVGLTPQEDAGPSGPATGRRAPSTAARSS